MPDSSQYTLRQDENRIYFDIWPNSIEQQENVDSIVESLRVARQPIILLGSSCSGKSVLVDLALKKLVGEEEELHRLVVHRNWVADIDRNDPGQNDWEMWMHQIAVLFSDSLAPPSMPGRAYSQSNANLDSAIGYIRHLEAETRTTKSVWWISLGRTASQQAEGVLQLYNALAQIRGERYLPRLIFECWPLHESEIPAICQYPGWQMWRVRSKKGPGLATNKPSNGIDGRSLLSPTPDCSPIVWLALDQNQYEEVTEVFKNVLQERINWPPEHIERLLACVYQWAGNHLGLNLIVMNATLMISWRNRPDHVNNDELNTWIANTLGRRVGDSWEELRDQLVISTKTAELWHVSDSNSLIVELEKHGLTYSEGEETYPVKFLTKLRRRRPPSIQIFTYFDDTIVDRIIWACQGYPNIEAIKEKLKELANDRVTEAGIVTGLNKLVDDDRWRWDMREFHELYYRLEINRREGPPEEHREFPGLPSLQARGRWLINWAAGRLKLDVVIEWLALERHRLFE